MGLLVAANQVLLCLDSSCSKHTFLKINDPFTQKGSKKQTKSLDFGSAILPLYQQSKPLSCGLILGSLEDLKLCNPPRAPIPFVFSVARRHEEEVEKKEENLGIAEAKTQNRNKPDPKKP